MKKILYIFLILSILSVGCSKEDDVQITQQDIPNLNENIFGVWDLSENDSRYAYLRSFSSNGKYGYFRLDYGVQDQYDTGEWWVEGNTLWLLPPDGFSTGFYYSVSGSTLTLNDGDWIKQ